MLNLNHSRLHFSAAHHAARLTYWKIKLSDASPNIKISSSPVFRSVDIVSRCIDLQAQVVGL